MSASPRFSSELYPHKKAAFEQALNFIQMKHSWLLVEGAGSGVGTSCFMQHLYQYLPSQGYQSLYVEAAPQVESSYPISEKIARLFDTDLVLQHKTAFHSAIELLRRYNFSSLYILCDLTHTAEASSLQLLKEAQFLWRHSPKNHLRFVFSKNWITFGDKDHGSGQNSFSADSADADKLDKRDKINKPGNPAGSRVGGAFDMGGMQALQTIQIPPPESEDIKAHVEEVFTDIAKTTATHYHLDEQFYPWMAKLSHGNLVKVSGALAHLTHQAKLEGLSSAGERCDLDFEFAQQHVAAYLAGNAGKFSSASSAA